MEPPTVPHVNLPPRRHRPQQQIRGVDVSASASSGPMSQPSHTGTHRLAPYSTVGQFSLAPTTQTTVVTTTTTTTTSFPQLLMRPPRNLNELDPKEFPLAAVPTPSNLKRFCFDLNGKPTHFRETDDPEQSLREVRSGIPARSSDRKWPFADRNSWTCLYMTLIRITASSEKLSGGRNACRPIIL